MLPVGGVDSEAVEHTTVVHGFIIIIPAWFQYIFTLIVSSEKQSINLYLLTLLCCCRSSAGDTLG